MEGTGAACVRMSRDTKTRLVCRAQRSTDFSSQNWQKFIHCAGTIDIYLWMVCCQHGWLFVLAYVMWPFHINWYFNFKQYEKLRDKRPTSCIWCWLHAEQQTSAALLQCKQSNQCGSKSQTWNKQLDRANCGKLLNQKPQQPCFYSGVLPTFYLQYCSEKRLIFWQGILNTSLGKT